MQIKSHFFSRRTLTEKLIELVPDIDIHIIPDTVQAENYRKRHYEIHWKHPSARDLLLDTAYFYCLYGDWSFVRKTSFYRYQCGDHLYSWSAAYFCSYGMDISAVWQDRF